MSTFRFAFISAIGLGLIVLFSHVVNGAEICMTSADAVRASYPGAWPTWRGPRYAKCWYPEIGRHTIRRDAAVRPKSREVERLVERAVDWGAGAVPREDQVRMFDETLSGGLDVLWFRHLAR